MASTSSKQKDLEKVLKSKNSLRNRKNNNVYCQDMLWCTAIEKNQRIEIRAVLKR